MDLVICLICCFISDLVRDKKCVEIDKKNVKKSRFFIDLVKKQIFLYF